jgi:hypothetical protein
MDTRKVMRGYLEMFRWQYTQKASILALMEKTTKPEELAKMREEQLGPLGRRIADFEECLRSADDGTQE